MKYEYKILLHKSTIPNNKICQIVFYFQKGSMKITSLLWRINQQLAKVLFNRNTTQITYCVAWIFSRGFEDSRKTSIINSSFTLISSFNSHISRVIIPHAAAAWSHYRKQWQPASEEEADEPTSMRTLLAMGVVFMAAIFAPPSYSWSPAAAAAKCL